MLQRLITALILVAIVGIAMFAFDSFVPFLALLLFGNAVAAYEWTKLLPKQTGIASPIMFVLLAILLSVIALSKAFILIGWWALVPWWVASIIIWLTAVAWVRAFPDKVTWYDNRLVVLGLALLTAAISAMFYLWSSSPWWLLYVFWLVWSADTGAYFAGKQFGKTKMAPKVSPNKSMEGLYGGLALGTLMVLLVSFIELKYSGLQLLYFVMLSGITIVASVFGDLFESMLKRQAGVKDSGNILPGHGGILDRIDSLLSATPIFALGFWLMQKLF